MLFICYPRCSTCRRAREFLESRGLPFDFRDISRQNPTEEELRAWQALSGLPWRRFFNTSGQKYRALGLAEKLDAMSEAEQVALLATDGLLVRRPLLVGDGFVLVGFREEAWRARLG